MARTKRNCFEVWTFRGLCADNNGPLDSIKSIHSLATLPSSDTSVRGCVRKHTHTHTHSTRQSSQCDRCDCELLWQLIIYCRQVTNIDISRRMSSPVMLRSAALVRTDVSEERSASIAFHRSVLRLLVTANVVPSSLILVTLIMVALRSSESRFFQEPSGVTCQKTAVFTFTAV
jgi:hypothetical protein